VSDERFEQFGLGAEDRAAWATSGAADFDAWLLDRVARRPAGTRARAVYGAEEVHDFARRAILAALALGPQDRLLEIGCGGGLLLRDARATGAHVVGLDHSEEMVRLAAEHAVIVHASADALPFADRTFTAVAMSVVFIFLPDPAAVLAECMRVLEPGGRLAVYTTGPELRGTPAAPEPFAGLSHFHTDAELVSMASAAGFADAAVVNEGGGQLLTARA
jgi:SAM-dependent methyltransferase